MTKKDRVEMEKRMQREREKAQRGGWYFDPLDFAVREVDRERRRVRRETREACGTMERYLAEYADLVRK